MRTRRTPTQEKAYRSYLAAVANESRVRKIPHATQQQFETVEFEVRDSLRHLYNTVSLKRGESVKNAVLRVFPELGE